MLENAGSLTKVSEPEKRIFLVNSIVKEFIQMAWESREEVDDGPFTVAFLRTGAILPIDGSKDNQVKIQGIERYDFASLTSEKIEAAMQRLAEADATKLKLQEAKCHEDLQKKAACTQKFSGQAALFQEAGDAGAKLLPDISAAACKNASSVCEKAASHLKESFYGYGSFFAFALQCAIPKDRLAAAVPQVSWDDVDIGIGTPGLCLCLFKPLF